MSEAEHHEFIQYKKTPYCGINISTTEGHRCGQLANAEVHMIDSDRGKTINHSAPERIWIEDYGKYGLNNRYHTEKVSVDSAGYIREDVALDRAISIARAEKIFGETLSELDHTYNEAIDDVIVALEDEKRKL